MSEKYIKIDDALKAVRKYRKAYERIPEVTTSIDAYMKDAYIPTYTPAEIMAGQWVPVAERLPEDGEICLLYKAGFGIGLFQYQTDGGFFADKDAHQFDRDSGGVFWQPLPQPPKEANP